MYNIIQNKHWWYSISGVVLLLSIISLSLWGLNLGIDFTGGSLTELSFNTDRPSNEKVQTALAPLNLPFINLQPVGDKGLLIRSTTLTEEQHQDLLLSIEQIANPEVKKQEGVLVKPEALGLQGEGLEGVSITASGEGLDQIPENLKIYQSDSYNSFTEQRFDSIGPVLGQELKTKSVYAIIFVLLAIIAYIAYAFRKVSYPVESWKYGVSAIIALIHNTIILLGVFSVLGHFAGVQIDAYFVTALLTLLGFSVHDTIVTFDRTRENLPRHQDKTFENVVNMSVNETLIRSINTSSAIFVLLAIFLFGGETIKYFSLALIIGVLVGTYSSIFIASPLLLVWYKIKKY
ncbi:MAG: protein translocase subunit SecF [Candidatus Komeilibacteria bacterium]|nr:protein translocase subunit SecF [Candidatus Komeilibacteria bacterium]